MSGVGVVNYLLSNTAGVTALVPAASILTGPIPLGSPLPALGVSQVSGVEWAPVRIGSSEFTTDRVQVTAHAETYAAKRAILDAARDALARQKGTINGVHVDAIMPDGVGPDLDDPGASIYEQSRDFLVRYKS